MYIETAIHSNKHEAYVEVKQSNRHGNIVDVNWRNLNIDRLYVYNISYYIRLKK